MAIVAIRKNVWDAASNSQHSILSLAMAELHLGTPATYRDGGQEWYVWADSRMAVGHVATWGMLVKGLAGLPRDWEPEPEDTRADTERNVHEFVKDGRVHPRDIDYGEAANRWQHTLEAQGAPAGVKAFASVPADWEVVTDGG